MTSMVNLVTGQKAKVRSSRHPDVLAGTVGVIRGASEGGYWVEIDGDWLIAGSDRGATRHAIVQCWYPAHEVEAV